MSYLYSEICALHEDMKKQTKQIAKMIKTQTVELQTSMSRRDPKGSFWSSSFESLNDPKNTTPQTTTPNISKDIQDIHDIQSKYKIPSGADPRGPWLGPGRARLVFCIYFVHLVHLVYLWI